MVCYASLTVDDFHVFTIPSDLYVGSCQFPTLGFVVDRYFRVRNFVPEKFWSIKIMHQHDNMDVTFSWRRHRLFDRASVITLFERCLKARTVKVSKLQKKSTSKWRPLPLTTVELQKLGSMFLRMDSQKVMKVYFLLWTSSGLLTNHTDCRRPVQQRMDQLPSYRD